MKAPATFLSLEAWIEISSFISGLGLVMVSAGELVVSVNYATRSMRVLGKNLVQVIYDDCDAPFRTPIRERIKHAGFFLQSIDE